MRKRSQAEQLSLFLTPDQASRISGLGVNRFVSSWKIDSLNTCLSATVN